MCIHSSCCLLVGDIMEDSGRNCDKISDGAVEQKDSSQVDVYIRPQGGKRASWKLVPNKSRSEEGMSNGEEKQRAEQDSEEEEQGEVSDLSSVHSEPAVPSET